MNVKGLQQPREWGWPQECGGIAGFLNAASAFTAAMLAFNIPVRRPPMGWAGLKAEYSESGP
jgi:hypothetical protein